MGGGHSPPVGQKPTSFGQFFSEKTIVIKEITNTSPSLIFLFIQAEVYSPLNLKSAYVNVGFFMPINFNHHLQCSPYVNHKNSNMFWLVPLYCLFQTFRPNNDDGYDERQPDQCSSNDCNWWMDQLDIFWLYY